MNLFTRYLPCVRKNSTSTESTSYYFDDDNDNNYTFDNSTQYSISHFRSITKNLFSRVLCCVKQNSITSYTIQTDIKDRTLGIFDIIALANETTEAQYFDLVPPDALFIVLRHLSKQPYSQSPLRLHAKDALMVLQCGGGLSAASREMLTSMTLDDIECITPNDYLFLANIMAPHLERLCVYEPNYFAIDFGRITSLRSLIFDEGDSEEDLSNDLDDVLSSCGHSLKEIELKGGWMKETTVEAIGEYCNSLEALCLSYGMYPASLEPIWNERANTLIKLRGCIPERELNNIALHCTKLDELALWNLDEILAFGRDTVLNLIGCLKSLQTLVFHMYDDNNHLTAYDMNMLLEVCSPNVHVHFIDIYGAIDNIQDYLRVIGSRLRLLRLNSAMSVIQKELLPAFCNIEELALGCCSANHTEQAIDIIQSIFVQCLPNLRILCIRDVDHSNILPIIAKSVSNLREFQCSFLLSESFAHVSHFNLLFRNNPHLSYISLDLPSCDTISSSSIIANFKGFHHLRHVEISTVGRNQVVLERSQEIRNACVSLRTVSLSLSVDGVRYLPS